MKKKEIQVELNEKIYQLIDKLHEINNDTIKKESDWIKAALKDNLTLEECLKDSLEDLAYKAIKNLTLKDK